MTTCGRMKQRMPSITNQTTPNPIACLTQNANRQNRWSFKPEDRDQLLENLLYGLSLRWDNDHWLAVWLRNVGAILTFEVSYK